MIKIPAIILICFSMATRAQTSVNIPGTGVSLISPALFQPSTTFAGIERDSADIQVFEMDGNFYKNAGAFSKRGFEQEGAKVLEYKDTTINGYKARYAYVEVKSARNHALIFGDSTFCTMLMGMVAGKDKRLNEEVKRSLFSVTYQKKPDNLGSTFFTLDERQSTFKFARSRGTSFTFTPGGTSSNEPGVPVILAIALPSSPSTAESVAGTGTHQILKNATTFKPIRNKWAGKVNGYDAYEEELYYEKADKEAMTYELAVSNGKSSVLFLCTAYTDYELTLKEFKALVKTVKFK